MRREKEKGEIRNEGIVCISDWKALEKGPCFIIRIAALLTPPLLVNSRAEFVGHTYHPSRVSPNFPANGEMLVRPPIPCDCFAW